MRKLTRPILLADSPEKNADVRYAVGLSAPDPIVCVVRGRDRYVIVPGMELGRVRRLGSRVHAFTPEDLVGKGKPARRSSAAVALLRRLAIRSVDVPSSFPLEMARHLEREGIRLTVVPDPLFPARSRKRSEEIARIREAQCAAVLAMDAAIAMIAAARPDRHGVLTFHGQTLTSEAVRAQLNQVLAAQQCSGGEIIVAGGARSADPHEAGEGPLRAGELIVIDIFPRHFKHGYWGDLTRTVVRGCATARQRGMYRAVRAAQSRALDRLRAGVTGASVHAAAVTEFERRRFPTQMAGGGPSGFIHGTGHGVGLDIHEAPSLNRIGGPLRAGNVVTVEPGLYYPDVGGIRIEDTVVVTSTGWRYLARCRHIFEL